MEIRAGEQVVNKLVEGIIEDMNDPNYVPVEAEVLVVIADALRRIADSLTK